MFFKVNWELGGYRLRAISKDEKSADYKKLEVICTGCAGFCNLKNTSLVVSPDKGTYFNFNLFYPVYGSQISIDTDYCCSMHIAWGFFLPMDQIGLLVNINSRPLGHQMYSEFHVIFCMWCQFPSVVIRWSLQVTANNSLLRSISTVLHNSINKKIYE